MQAAQVLIAAIVSRLKDADAKARLAAAGTYCRGKFCPMKPIANRNHALLSHGPAGRLTKCESRVWTGDRPVATTFVESGYCGNELAKEAFHF